jgi:hypothetical protein
MSEEDPIREAINGRERVQGTAMDGFIRFHSTALLFQYTDVIWGLDDDEFLL